LETTYNHIKTRGKVLRAEKIEMDQKLKAQAQHKKSIYNKFKQPDGTLKLPLSDPPTEMELKQAEWFNNLPEDYKGAI
jgi:hypothetical protein